MNNFKIYNENEIKNKLKNFTENQDYKVFPAEEPNQKIYTFQNEWLKSFFGGVNRVPVRVWQEKYDDQNFSYRGHFEQGKDYQYSAQSWTYGKGYQHKPGEWFPISEWREENITNSDWGRTTIRGRIKGNNSEPKKIEPSFQNFLEELKWKHNQLVDKLNSLSNRPESDFGANGKEKKEYEITEVKKDIANIEREIEKEKSNPWGGWGEKNYYNPDIQQRGRTGRNEAGKWIGDNYSDLKKENQELKKQLIDALEELKKLRNNSTGQNNAKLDQQIDYNEKLIHHVEEVPEAEMKEQVQKSQALLENAMVNTNSQFKNDNKNSSVPYLIWGSVLIGSVLLVSGYLISKRKSE